MRPILPLAVAAAALWLVAGCGTDDAGDDVTRPANDTTELTVVVRDGSGGEQTYTLTCDPAGGDHPDPEAACRALDRMEDPFAPVPRDRACAEIYGGPQTATVTGTYRGKPVKAEFKRTDACQMDRWDKHVALLVEAGGAAGS